MVFFLFVSLLLRVWHCLTNLVMLSTAQAQQLHSGNRSPLDVRNRSLPSPSPVPVTVTEAWWEGAEQVGRMGARSAPCSLALGHRDPASSASIDYSPARQGEEEEEEDRRPRILSMAAARNHSGA